MVRNGVAGEETSIITELRRVFEANRLYGVYVGPRRQSAAEGRKAERIMNGLLAYYETMSVIHCGDLSRLEYQLEYLGKADSDDLADSLEVLFFNLEQPEDIDIACFNSSNKVLNTRALIYNTQFDWRTS